ncbi:hypothetical protein [Nocardia blacklockiae]|uniref:hypothetical protein n=1 Tax=Nocardia blacklockiae TaxID=480036 RepID=UPI001894CA3B|nr:hypothetical protein [Nocardia blacklockiae]MBF6172911.1 hypothetical protein [Nocardia blacklockiae]
MSEQSILIAVPGLCGVGDVELAHELMRRHRQCRRGRCVWKSAAYQTLVLAGRLTPQTVTARERAAGRGIEFPVLCAESASGAGGPGHETLREVLDRLSALAEPSGAYRVGGS